ncbi:MAG: class I SAM-dependent methyltransferase [Hyphomicrobiales bacterium]|nr:class I SAM-dependent methyltransferase [Hyphomicrobiales bacterium]
MKGSIEVAQTDAVAIQRHYYRNAAASYDDAHVSRSDEHAFALAYMLGAIAHFDIHSVLDIGSGTGRALLHLKERAPHLRTVGIEPSFELRAVGHSKGLTSSELMDGDAMKLPFEDGAFDMVCEYGALHHIPRPGVAVSEMLRVAKRAIFISDCNNFGQGHWLNRLVKQAIDSVGAWRIADYVKTGGKGYAISEGDGLFYSYSVFDDYQQIRRQCKSVHVLNTTDAGPSLYRTASHVALLGLKA